MHPTAHHLTDPELFDEAIATSGLARGAYVAAGTLALGLGILGAFLPVMPTTVFVLIAAACYARGSARAYRRLSEHRLFGPLIRDWRRHRAIPSGARRVAIAMIVVAISGSFLAVEAMWVRGLLVVTAVGLVAFLLRLPSRESVATDAAGTRATG